MAQGASLILPPLNLKGVETPGPARKFTPDDETAASGRVGGAGGCAAVALAFGPAPLLRLETQSSGAQSPAVGPTGRPVWSPDAAHSCVEREPVSARLPSDPAAWAWSSAAAHLSRAQPLPGRELALRHDSGGAARWSQLLAEPDAEARLPRIRRATEGRSTYSRGPAHYARLLPATHCPGEHLQRRRQRMMHQGK